MKKKKNATKQKEEKEKKEKRDEEYVGTYMHRVCCIRGMSFLGYIHIRIYLLGTIRYCSLLLVNPYFNIHSKVINNRARASYQVSKPTRER